jgi:hypothetical protein
LAWATAAAEENANPEPLARLLNGSLVDAAFWIAEGSDTGERLPQALHGLELLLRGLLVR